MFKLTVRNSTNIMLLSAVVLTLLFLVCYEFIIIKEHEYVIFLLYYRTIMYDLLSTMQYNREVTVPIDTIQLAVHCGVIEKHITFI